MVDRVRIATRKSPLALWQAEYVKSALESAHPGIEVEIIGMSTKGDKILDTPLAKVGGKGLFVKELEVALQEQRADIAVHSMKDVPMELPPGLSIEAICPREDFRDAFVSNQFASLSTLPQGAKVGTSSLRRQCQLRAMRPDLQILDLRGNVNSRLRKLDEGQYDGIILAAAGLKRLKFDERITDLIAPEVSLPAVGQGAVGIECRSDDERTIKLLAPLNDPDSHVQVSAERSMNFQLQGGCQVPIAGFAVLEGDQIYLRGLVGYVDGSEIFRAEARGPQSNAIEIGRSVAEQLLKSGAGKALEMAYGEAE